MDQPKFIKYDNEHRHVVLVWGVREGGRCDLIAVAADADAVTRYEEAGLRLNIYKIIKSETVTMNHMFGMGMLPNALNRVARER